jgi:hypothetical protein
MASSAVGASGSSGRRGALTSGGGAWSLLGVGRCPGVENVNVRPLVGDEVEVMGVKRVTGRVGPVAARRAAPSDLIPSPTLVQRDGYHAVAAASEGKYSMSTVKPWCISHAYVCCAGGR